MKPRHVCLLLLALPLAAQSPFRATRHAGLPAILWGDKFAAGDVDGDGDVDLVVANDNAPNQLLLNDGNGRFTDATAGRFVTPPPSNATHSIDLVDIDGDGDLDILVGNDDWLSNRVYVNNGAGVFTDTTATALPPNLEFTQNQVVADFDGDGDVDWFTVDFGVCHFYDNNGAGVFTDMSAARLANLPTTLGMRFAVTPHAADVDGDGDLDVLVPGSTRPFLIVNQAGVLRPSPVPLPAVTGTTNWFADIDGDGDPDIFVNSGQTILQNQGNGTFVDVTNSAFPGTHGPGLACFDVDLDGDVDLVTSTILWLNNGAGSFVAQAGATSLLYGYALGSASADFDGDGDIDLAGQPNFLRQVDALAAPVRGTSYSLAIHTRPAAASIVAALGALAGRITPFPPLGVLRLDPASTLVLSVQNVTAGPLVLTWSLPSSPVFAGLRLHYQAAIADPVNGLLLSNAIVDVVQ